MADKTPRDREADEELLQEIRDRYTHYSTAWKERREHSQKCRKYLDGDPWEEKDRKARKEAGRPCINHDELNQYVNQATGNARQNKRGIKVNPGGEGSSEKTAEFRSNLIRGIEYRSHAQQAYITAYEQMLEGSYGFLRIGRKYVNRRKSKDQEITISAIQNPDSVLYDPDCKNPDGSDAAGCFVLDPIPRAEFKRRFPNAEVKDFTSEDMAIAKDWLMDQQVLIAEYWRRTGNEDDGYEIAQYITNGIEILEELPQPGEHLGIIPFFGKQRYISEGGVAKPRLYSIVSFALEPQLSLAYLATQQLEEAGLSPKVPYKGWKGQFEADQEGWEDLNKTPRSYIQADYPQWAIDAGIPLQLPQREQFTPNFQEYEVAKDSARRAIQAAIGSSPLPTAAQRSNEKSGVALEKIADQMALGSFHFLDNYERGIEYAGRVVEEWIPVVYDTEREVAIRLKDDTHKVVRINTPAPYLDAKGEQHHYPVGDDGEHDLEISAAPSYQSEREAAASFLDTLVSNIQQLPITPPQAAKLLSLAIQMRQLGPKGDEMAEIISPAGNQPMNPQAMAQIQQAQVQMQQQAALIQQLQAELVKLQNEKQAKIVDNEYKMSIEKLRIDAQLAMAEVNTKAQQLNERLKFVEDIWQQLHGQQHEAGMQAADQAHEQSLQAGQQQHEQQLAEQQAAAAQQQAAEGPTVSQ